MELVQVIDVPTMNRYTPCLEVQQQGGRNLLIRGRGGGGRSGRIYRHDTSGGSKLALHDRGGWWGGLRLLVHNCM